MCSRTGALTPPLPTLDVAPTRCAEQDCRRRQPLPVPLRHGGGGRDSRPAGGAGASPLPHAAAAIDVAASSPRPSSAPPQAEERGSLTFSSSAAADETGDLPQRVTALMSAVRLNSTWPPAPAAWSAVCAALTPPPPCMSLLACVQVRAEHDEATKLGNAVSATVLRTIDQIGVMWKVRMQGCAGQRRHGGGTQGKLSAWFVH